MRAGFWRSGRDGVSGVSEREQRNGDRGGAGVARREFLKLVGVGAGAAAVSCQDSPRRLYPYITPPRQAAVGEASYYASVCRECAAGCGLVVRVREGRAIKLEGSPEHPINRGALCARGQAGLLRTYSPWRLPGPQVRTDGGFERLSWTQAFRRVGEALGRAGGRGEGRVLLWSGLETGTLRELMEAFAQAFGGRHLMFDPAAVEPMLEAHRLAFGRSDLAVHALGGSDVVLALEADLFETYGSPVELARQIVGDARGGPRAELIWAGPRRGVTGMLADRWVPSLPGASGLLALALVKELVAAGGGAASAAASIAGLEGLLASSTTEDLARRAGVEVAEVRAVARRLAAARSPVALPPGAVAAGPHGVGAQAAVVLLNVVLGAYGRSLLVPEAEPASALASVATAAELREAVDRMSAGDVEVLVVAGQNPVFDLPGGLDVAAAIERVRRDGLVVAIADRLDATAELADVVLAASSPLESWGDYAPRAGLTGLMQPVLEPLFQTKMTGDVLIGLARAAGVSAQVAPEARSFEVAVRRRWHASWGLTGEAAEARFCEVQRRGFEEATSASGGSVQAPALRPEALEAIARGLGELLGPEGRQVRVAPYAPIGSGLSEQTSGGWLEELPEPTTAAVWGSPAELHPETAAALGIEAGATIEVETEAGAVRLPAVVHEAVRPGVVALPVGGRTERPERGWPEAPAHDAPPRGDSLASAASRLLPASALRPGAGVIRAGHLARLATASRPVRLFVETRHFDQHGRDIARARGVETHRHHAPPIMGRESAEERRRVDMYGDRPYARHRWAMAIDLDRCTGCSACIVACQAENNVAVVGPAHVDYGREMAWLQLHTYWERDREGRPIPLHLPMLCQHCHQAPCESVCPVYAPYHTPEGLNGQVYNRCVGTRFCANNCPYKVRRFNWYDWPRPEPLELQLNPDVTVRTAGVMEKCTFCVQRIREAEEESRITGLALVDGDVKPACVQTCPTGALVFGDWLDEGSRLRRLVEAEAERGYHVLGHVGTRPAITYLERVLR